MVCGRGYFPPFLTASEVTQPDGRMSAVYVSFSYFLSCLSPKSTTANTITHGEQVSPLHAGLFHLRVGAIIVPPINDVLVVASGAIESWSPFAAMWCLLFVYISDDHLNYRGVLSSAIFSVFVGFLRQGFSEIFQDTRDQPLAQSEHSGEVNRFPQFIFLVTTRSPQCSCE